MALNMRKLLSYSDNLTDAITKYCAPYCDPTVNRDGLCPVSCISRSFQIGKSSLFPPPPVLDYLSNSNDHHHSSGSYRLSVSLTITLAILATGFFIFCCYSLYKFCIVWHRSRRQQQPTSQQRGEEIYLNFIDEYRGPTGIDHPIWYIRTVGLQISVISAIPVCKYKKGDGLVEGTECSVCLSEFQEDETLRLLPKCNHAFHLPCIDTWLRSHTSCPLCRAAISINCPSLQPREELSTHDYQQSQVANYAYQNESGRGGEMSEEVFHVSIEVEDEESRAQNESRRNEDFVEDVGNSEPINSLSTPMVSVAVSDSVSANSDILVDKQGNQTIESNIGLPAKSVEDDDDHQISVAFQPRDDCRKG